MRIGGCGGGWKAQPASPRPVARERTSQAAERERTDVRTGMGTPRGAGGRGDRGRDEARAGDRGGGGDEGGGRAAREGALPGPDDASKAKRGRLARGVGPLDEAPA